MLVTNGSTPTIVFLLVDATDGETPETGLTPTVYLSKNGGTAATATNAAAEIDSTNLPGWYSLALTATETGTDGPLIVYADSGSTTKTWYDVHQVVTSVTAALSAGSMSSRSTAQVMARYMAPEFTMMRPRRAARFRARVDLPEAAGPSMAMAKCGVSEAGFTRGK